MLPRGFADVWDFIWACADCKLQKKKSDIVILFGFERLSEYLILVLFSTAVSYVFFNFIILVSFEKYSNWAWKWIFWQLSKWAVFKRGTPWSEYFACWRNYTTIRKEAWVSHNDVIKVRWFHKLKRKFLWHSFNQSRKIGKG